MLLHPILFALTAIAPAWAADGRKPYPPPHYSRWGPGGIPAGWSAEGPLGGWGPEGAPDWWGPGVPDNWGPEGPPGGWGPGGSPFWWGPDGPKNGWRRPIHTPGPIKPVTRWCDHGTEGNGG
ncbi:hypothetical protein E4U42_002435, partial [Claviceps africana]